VDLLGGGPVRELDLMDRRAGAHDDAGGEAGLLEDLPERGCLEALSGVDVALRKGPVVVGGAVDDQDLESGVALDEDILIPARPAADSLLYVGGLGCSTPGGTATNGAA
jgi:hypothetical protein